jgi:hypothetical protein
MFTKQSHHRHSAAAFTPVDDFYASFYLKLNAAPYSMRSSSIQR